MSNTLGSAVAIFRCAEKTERPIDYSPNAETGFEICLIPIAPGDDHPEAAEFFEATPSGEIRLSVVNPPAADQFKVGRFYRVRFDQEPAEGQSE